MKTNLFLLLLLMTFSVSAQQISKQLTAENGRLIGFLEYKPADYDQADNNRKYPLIVFLHGTGEKGNGTTELSKVTANGIPKYIQEGNAMRFTWKGKTETFIVLTPQLSPEFDAWPVFYAEEMIQYAKANLNIDTNRIILTGLSLGGGGVWNYSASNDNNAKQLAAIGVSCGTKPLSSYRHIADQRLPTWAFHASDDEVVSVRHTLAIIRNINSYHPAVTPYQTIWPTGGHFIWDRVFDTTHEYQNPNIYEWFIAQNKSYPVNTRPTANAGDNITVSSATAAVTLNASHSADADGTLERFVWRQISGPAKTELSKAVSKDGKCYVSGVSTPGVYSFELKAIDDRADFSLDTVFLTVSDPMAPVANAGEPQVINDVLYSAVLDGTSSFDKDGAITQYQWTMTEGPSQAVITNPDSIKTSVTGLIPGLYTFRLTVTDNREMTSISYTTITVNRSLNLRPRARAGKDDTLVAPASSFVADGTKSYDRDGKITGYRWVKLLGPSRYTIETPDSAITTFSDLVEGRYKFRLIVYDDQGDSAMDNLYIYVNQPITLGAANNSRFNIEESTSATTIKLYPNPASVTTTLQFHTNQESTGSITVRNASGQQIKTMRTNFIRGVNQIPLNIQGLRKGVYYLSIVAGANFHFVQRLVVN